MLTDAHACAPVLVTERVLAQPGMDRVPEDVASKIEKVVIWIDHQRGVAAGIDRSQAAARLTQKLGEEAAKRMHDALERWLTDPDEQERAVR